MEKKNKFKKFKNRKNAIAKSHKLYKILFLIVFFMSAGFAAFYTTLGIEGLSTIFPPKLNVYVTQTAVTSGSATASSAASIVGNDKKEVDFSVSLPSLTSFYEVSTTLSNKGRKKAYYYIEDIKLYDASGNEITTWPSELECTVLDTNGNQVVVNHELAAGASEVFKIKFNYKSDATLPATQPVYTVKVIYDYQLTEQAVTASMVTYSSSYTTKTNVQDALDEIAGMLE